MWAPINPLDSDTALAHHEEVQADLRSGTVTFVFTDVEGSTKLLREVGAEAYAEALAEHRRILRTAFGAHNGTEIDTQGDAFFYVFPTGPRAIEAAIAGQEALSMGPIRVRIGIHTGTAHPTEEGYVGDDVHKGARVAAAGHGGQVLITKETHAPEDLDVLDLGEHRLKDFDEPVWILQLGSERFPPLKTISNTNLPRPASSFVGRDHEMQEVVSLLQNGSRLLTLTGPGGSGKTRLAIEAAAELVPEFRNGVFWVGLAAVRDPALVTEEIAQTLGAKDDVADFVAGRELLLLIDNFEQVVDAAPEVSTLLSTSPNLRIMVTSRELLRIQGEVEYAVPPLSRSEAVELFCARSRLEPDSTIAELCARLDDLPLAVELAAARTSVLTPADILQRLAQRLDLLKGGRDADPRQATLRATIEWSHDLLSNEEKTLFARLAVFAGGCTLESAEQVAKADLDILQSLVDKSLVRRTAQRFWMLETIYEFALERLGERSEEMRTLRERHLDHMLAVAERAWEGRNTSESKWLPILGAEHDNIRAALDWARDNRPGAEAQLAGAVTPYWFMRGHALEALERLGGTVSRYGTPDHIRARALTHLGEAEDSLARLEEALTLWRDLGDARGEAFALEAIGWIHDVEGNYSAAQLAYEQGLAILQESGAPELEGSGCVAGLCHVFVASGRTKRAEAAARELLTLTSTSDASLIHELALHFLADCPLVDGDYPEAERRYRRALAFARSAGLVVRATDEVLGVAMALAGQGDSTRALRLAAAAYAEQEAIGKGSDHWWRTMQERLIGGARAHLGPDEAETAERAGRGLAFDAALDEVLGAVTQASR
jgi:predicted ATPase/class 3 adenylate cyclase